MQMMIEEAKNFDIQVFLAFMNVVHTADLERILDTEKLSQALSHAFEGKEFSQEEEIL